MSYFRSLRIIGRRFFSTETQGLANAAETQISTLNNGFRVVTEQTPVKTASVGLFISAGSRLENAKNNGAAHFLEHMAFKGTQNRGQRQMEMEVENMGAQLNAYTSREQTCYFAKCFNKDVDRSIDILADIIKNPKFEESAIEAERSVILRELQEVNSIPEEVVFDYLHTTAFMESPLGYTILGPEENIKSISRQDLVNYVNEHYTAPRMALVAVGDVDHAQVVKQAEQMFGDLSNADNTPESPKPQFNGSELRFRDDFMPQASFAIAVEGASFSSPDYFPLMVASSIVGTWDRSFGGASNMSSKLARTAISENLANSFMSFNTSYQDTGLWGIYANAERMSVEDFCFEATQEWMRIATSATEGEVTRAKNALKSAMIFQLDGTTPMMQDIGNQILTLGRRMQPMEIAARIDAVDAATVRKVMSEYVMDRCPAVAGIGPVEGLPDYNRLRSNLVWLRM